MSNHDMIIDNAVGATVRADMNAALAALVSNNSSATEPATMYAYMWWADTTAGILKQRNAANSAWISILTLSTGANTANALLAGSASQAFSTAALTVAGLLDISEAAAGQIKFPATQNSSADANTLDDYAEGSFTLTGVGWTAGITVTIYYTKIGDLVHWSQQDALTGTSNSTSKSGSGIPTALRPSSARYIHCTRSQDAGSNAFGRAVINSDGTIDWGYSAAASLATYTASGTTIIQPTEFTYKL